MSVPMTSSDLERRDARGQIFQADHAFDINLVVFNNYLLNNARTV